MTCDHECRVTSVMLHNDLGSQITLAPRHLRALVEKLTKALEKVEE